MDSLYSNAHHVLDTPYVSDDDEYSLDSVEKRRLETFRTNPETAPSFDKISRSWYFLTVDDLVDATGFYFTINTDSFIEKGLQDQPKPYMQLSSTLVFSMQDIACDMSNPYGIVMGLSRLLTCQSIAFDISTVQYRVDEGNFLMCDVTFRRDQLGEISPRLVNNALKVSFKLMPNAHRGSHRRIIEKTSFRRLSVFFSLRDLTKVVAPKDNPTEATQKDTVYEPKPAAESKSSRRRLRRGKKLLEAGKD
jgi:hypothetical protein